MSDDKDPKGSSTTSTSTASSKDERSKSIDGLKKEELAAAGGEQYPYLDQTRDLHVPLAGRGDGLSSAVLNPAYYPKNVKPEILHTEAEKAGADFPEGDPDAKDESKKGEDFKFDAAAAPVGYAELLVEKQAAKK